MSGFVHSIADSMRESSGVIRHDSHKADEPPVGVGDKIKASLAGVTGAAQSATWSVSAPSAPSGNTSVVEKVYVDAGVEGVSGSLPTVGGEGLGSAEVSMPPVEGNLDVKMPAGGVSGNFSPPGGEVSVGGECVCFTVHIVLDVDGSLCFTHLSFCVDNSTSMLLIFFCLVFVSSPFLHPASLPSLIFAFFDSFYFTEILLYGCF